MPEYKGNLLAQSYVNQLRFLKGSWTAKADGEISNVVGKIRRTTLPISS